MPHTFLIVGKSFSSLKQAIELRGDRWIVLKDKSHTQKSTGDNTLYVDFADMSVVLSTVDQLNQSTKIDAVVTIYEQYVLASSIIADHLNLPYLPINSARACTDKELMRSRFANSSKTISPKFQTISTLSEAKIFAHNHSFPLILKPANLVKSLLVLKCNDLDDLEKNYGYIEDRIEEVYKKYAPHNERKVIIEEFLEGSIHSVDAFVDSEGKVTVLDGIVDYQTGYDIGFEDNFHYSRLLPSKLTPSQQKELRSVARIGCEALGMKSSAAHVEIIMTKTGPRIVEIGARNGGYRERMHQLSHGLELMDILLDIKLGKSPKIVATKNEPCAVLELFPKTPGIFKGIKNKQELLKLPSLQYFKVKQKTGDYVGKAGDGYKMCAIIVLANPDLEQFQNDLHYINQHCVVTTT